MADCRMIPRGLPLPATAGPRARGPVAALTGRDGGMAWRKASASYREAIGEGRR